jgi:hypothetical protein
MLTLTADLNREPERCDAFHEAGHAVLGVVRGFRLKSVTALDTGGIPPHCAWDDAAIKALLGQRDKPGVAAQIEQFTERHAEMCFASRYAEEMACDISSDEQQDALHCDYLDAERVHYCCVGNYLGRTRVARLRDSARDLVNQHAAAVSRVAEKLLTGATLTHEQVEALIAGSDGQ